MSTTTATTTVTRRGRGTRRHLTAGAAAVVAVLVLSGCFSPNQTKALDQVNAARKSHRTAALVGETKAMAKAQAWSDHMARTGVLEHTGGGPRVDTSGLPRFCKLAENVGNGPTIQAVTDAFLRSPTHKANLLGPYDQVGLGVTKKGSTVWVTQIFLKTKGC